MAHGWVFPEEVQLWLCPSCWVVQTEVAIAGLCKGKLEILL